MRNLSCETAKNERSGITGSFCAFLMTFVLALTLQFSQADVPDSSAGEFQGMYKIASSTDPIFPVQSDREWFLDFGSGVSSGKLSGNVAVSLRQNPNVKVRIMAWQFFPKQNKIMIGNPYFEGSKNAVAKGNWQMRSTANSIIFERGTYQIILHRADPRDY